MYTQKMLQIALKQEQQLQFDKFDASDALALCILLTEISLPQTKPVAMQVLLEGFAVCTYYMDGTGTKNQDWITRKYNTVIKTGGSSLRAAMELELSGGEPANWQCDEKFALCGGGFPIIVRGKGIVGVFCISGLPHLIDHQMLTQTLAHYLNCSTELITG